MRPALSFLSLGALGVSILCYYCVGGQARLLLLLLLRIRGCNKSCSNWQSVDSTWGNKLGLCGLLSLHPASKARTLSASRDIIKYYSSYAVLNCTLSAHHYAIHIPIYEIYLNCIICGIILSIKCLIQYEHARTFHYIFTLPFLQRPHPIKLSLPPPRAADIKCMEGASLRPRFLIWWREIERLERRERRNSDVI